MAIRRIRFTCQRLRQSTDTHSDYLTLIASPRQQRLRERASMLRYTHIENKFKKQSTDDIVLYECL